MPGGLPAGLVTTTDNAGDEIGQADEIDLDTIARFWRSMPISSIPLQCFMNADASLYSLLCN